MNNKLTQRERLLELLKKAGSSGINSHDATYLHGIKQAPTRISELKEEGYEIHTSSPLKNRSVIWSLTFIPEQKKRIIDWDFSTGKARPIYEGATEFSNSPKPHDTATDVSLFQ